MNERYSDWENMKKIDSCPISDSLKSKIKEVL